ncbi:HNH endonuclease [Candidatus Woesearchaeota archaeon]|nr:HNH endonuclease [Candidatus Woesearchaeota archaeon]
MSYGTGNWVHSRVSSSKHERQSIVTLVEASKKYAGLRWSGSKDDPQNIAFSGEIGVNPSQMQTKIRAFIRFGFLKDKNVCPLEWTRLGEIWRNLVLNGGANLANYTDRLEDLILASALIFYSFDSNGISINPTTNYRPIIELFQIADKNGNISKSALERLIGVSNLSYWLKDLVNAGFLKQINNHFQIGDKFPILMHAVRNTSLQTNLTDSDWKQIKDDCLDNRNSYKSAILAELTRITEGVLDIEATLPLAQKDIVSEVLNLIDEEESTEIEQGDYKVPEEYGKAKKRKKQNAWSKKVREDYNYICAVPQCDIRAPEFTEAAHIKKYPEKEEREGHRANPYNGICLCPLCHSLFDKGYFTLSDELKITLSPAFSNLASHRLREAVEKSQNQKIKMPKRFLPKKEFISYHRTKTFRNS